MRTIKQILNSGEQIDTISFLLEDGTSIEGILIQERVDKKNDTEGYNIYDIRSGGEDYYGDELLYNTIEPNVWVDWADSIATKDTLDFGEQGYLVIDNSDITDYPFRFMTPEPEDYDENCGEGHDLEIEQEYYEED